MTKKELASDALQISTEAGRLSQDFIKLLDKCSGYDEKSIRAGAEKIEDISISAAEIAERVLFFSTGKRQLAELSEKLDSFSDDLIIWRALYEGIWNKTESEETEANGCNKRVS